MRRPLACEGERGRTVIRPGIWVKRDSGDWLWYLCEWGGQDRGCEVW